jgi:hypothetical protein
MPAVPSVIAVAEGNCDHRDPKTCSATTVSRTFASRTGLRQCQSFPDRSLHLTVTRTSSASSRSSVRPSTYACAPRSLLASSVSAVGFCFRACLQAQSSSVSPEGSAPSVWRTRQPWLRVMAFVGRRWRQAASPVSPARSRCRTSPTDRRSRAPSCRLVACLSSRTRTRPSPSIPADRPCAA